MEISLRWPLPEGFPDTLAMNWLRCDCTYVTEKRHRYQHDNTSEALTDSV